jgi:hypothetical protein
VHTIAPDDIVRTPQEGAQNERDPLLVTEPLEAFLDEHGIGSGPIEAEPGRRGPLERHVRHHPRRRRGRACAARHAGPLPPSAHDVLREARVIGALQGQRPRAGRARRVRRRAGHRRAVLRHGQGRRATS